MKKISVFLMSILVFGIIFSGCKKDEDDPIIPDPGSGSTCTNVIARDTTFYDDGVNPIDTSIKVYTYNANKKVVKVTYAFNSSPANAYDTIAYNGNGEIATVKSYIIGNPTPLQVKTYTYTGGKITSVNETGDNGAPYDRTRTFTYTAGVISKMAIVYNTGSREADDIDTLTNIVVTNGNITSAILRSSGSPLDNQTVSLAYQTTAPNPYLGMNNNVDDPLTLFNANNVTSATAGGGLVTIFTRTYSYANGRVATFNEVDGTSGEESNTVITYTCL